MRPLLLRHSYWPPAWLLGGRRLAARRLLDRANQDQASQDWVSQYRASHPQTRARLEVPGTVTTQPAFGHVSSRWTHMTVRAGPAMPPGATGAAGLLDRHHLTDGGRHGIRIRHSNHQVTSSASFGNSDGAHAQGRSRAATARKLAAQARQGGRQRRGVAAASNDLSGRRLCVGYEPHTLPWRRMQPPFVAPHKRLARCRVGQRR